MSHRGLIVTLVLAAIVGVAFGFFPQLDLMIAAPFHAIVLGGNNFGLRFYPPLIFARNVGLWVGALLILPAIAAFVIKLIFPTRKLLISGRAIVFLTATLALGPGLLVNVGLKNHWGRPRPIDVAQFGGDQHFVAWWDPRGDCPHNCSFVSGDVSGAFWTLAPAALAPPQWRALTFGAALALGIGMAVFRMLAGAHFFTDVMFAGVFTYLIIWVAHGLIYRWPLTRITDEGVERTLEGISESIHGFFSKRKADL